MNAAYAASAAARRGRRNPRRTSTDDLEEVATQVAHGALDWESEESPLAGQVIMKQAMAEPARNFAAADTKGGTHQMASNAIFQLPTPGRGGRNPPPPPPAGPPTPPANMVGALAGFSMPPPPAGPPASPPTAPPSMAPVMPPNPYAAYAAPAMAPPGAAPNLQEAQAPASRGNYREWLQARGQQAMNRSLNPAAPTGPLGTQSPTASPLSRSPLATTVSNSFGMSHAVCTTNPVPPMPSMRSAPPPPQAAMTQPAQQAAWGMPCEMQMQQQWYQQPEMVAGQSQGPPMIPGLCQRSASMLDCAQSPMGADGYPMTGYTPQVMGDCNGMQSPASAFAGMAGQQSPFGGHLSPFGQQASAWERQMSTDFSMGQLPMSAWAEDPMHMPMQQMPQPDSTQMGRHQMQQQQAISPSNCQPLGVQPQLCRDLSHEEMMARIIPTGAFGLDRLQLAQHLKAAAQCVDIYED